MEKRKVMIVDDDKEFLEEFQEALKLSDYEIIPVNDPMLALGVCSSQKPDVILLDIKMPKKSGFLLADEFKNSLEFKDVPIIAMSGCFKNKDSAFLSIYGFRSYMEKPFNPVDAVIKIEEALNKE